MKKTIWQDTKIQLKWFKEMTTMHNILSNILFWAILILAVFVCIGVLAAGIFGLNYMASLFNQADPGDKFNGILVLLGIPLGILLKAFYDRMVDKRKRNKKTADI